MLVAFFSDLPLRFFLRLVSLVSIVTTVAAQSSTRTCTRPCRLEGESSTEVFGKSSRCFESLLGTVRAHRCFAVECFETHYRITRGAGSATSCLKLATSAQQYFPGYDDWVGCESYDLVCDVNGTIILSTEEIRRVNVEAHLTRIHGSGPAQKLLAAYDHLRFNPHLEKENGSEGQYVVQLVEEQCSWGIDAQNAINDTFDDMYVNLGMVALTRVNSSGLLRILSDNCSAFVEQQVRLQLQGTRSVPWGIDYIDGVLDGHYIHNFRGDGVDVYVVDSGVDSEHKQLVGRVSTGRDCSKNSWDIWSGNRGNTFDFDGHGTHVAGTVAGSNTGVAPMARIVPVKVMDSSNNLNSNYLIRAMDFLIAEKFKRVSTRGRPMLASVSLGGPYHESLNKAVRKLVHTGVPTVVAAGNEHVDASGFSPASEQTAITVGAVGPDSNPAPFSNYGVAVDMWAPGVDILSATPGGSNDMLSAMSGTSMAAPHVSGAVALLLEANPSWGPADVERELLQDCSNDAGDKNIVMTYGSLKVSSCDLRCRTLSCVPTSTTSTASTTTTARTTTTTTTSGSTHKEHVVDHSCRVDVLNRIILVAVCFANLCREAVLFA